jgi:prevent-host-death family protein
MPRRWRPRHRRKSCYKKRRNFRRWWRTESGSTIRRLSRDGSVRASKTEGQAVMKTVSISVLRRRAGRVLSRPAKSEEPITITRRGRDAAVIMSPACYDEIEDSFRRLGELELREMVRAARQRANGGTVLEAIRLMKMANSGEWIDPDSRMLSLDSVTFFL